MTCYEICLFYIVGRLDFLISEPQVADSDTTGFFRVVLEVRLCIFIRIVTDDLDTVLIRTNSTVRSQSPEFAGNLACRFAVRHLAWRKRKSCYVICNRNSEFLLRMIGPEIFINCQQILWLCIFRAQSVTASRYQNVVEFAVLNSCCNIKQKRFAHRTRFLGTVQHCDFLYCIRQCFQEVLSGKRTIQTNNDQTGFLAVGICVIDSFFYGIAYRPHCYDDFLCIFSTVIVKWFIVRSFSRFFTYHIHVFRYDFYGVIIVFITCFSMLEKGFRLFCRTHAVRMIRVERVLTETLYCIPVNHAPQFIVIPHADFLLFMAGTESVEEMHYRHLACDGRMTSCTSEEQSIANPVCLHAITSE